MISLLPSTKGAKVLEVGEISPGCTYLSRSYGEGSRAKTRIWEGNAFSGPAPFISNIMVPDKLVSTIGGAMPFESFWIIVNAAH